MQDTDPGDLIAEDLQGIGLDAHAYGPYYYPNPPWSLEYMDYDMAWLRQPESGVEPSWWANHLHSSRIGRIPGNWPRYNSTDIDALADTIVNSSNPDDALSACQEMQSILLEECPVIPCYMPSKLQAYRGDRLAGITGSQGEGIIGWRSSYRGHLTETAGGPLGGTMIWAIPSGLETFNIMKVTTKTEKLILSHMYDSLYRLGPSGEMIPWLVGSFNATTHQDDAAVPEGHVRFTIDILENATWSDGEPITADDVSFTLQQFMPQETTNYWGDLSNLFSTFSLTSRRVAVEFNTTSYLHLADFAFIPILPSHVFQNMSPQDWNEWDPNPTSMVTSGPFNVSMVKAHERIIMKRRPDYFYWHGIETNDGNLGTLSFQLAIAAALIATGIVVFEILRRRTK
jgi:ABC-type transport system substrate-binding protein